MAAGVRSASAPARVSGGTIVVAKPAGLQVGDTLFGIHHSHSDDPTAPGIPAGFTRTDHEGGSIARGIFVLSYKPATADDVAATDFTFTDTDRGVAGILALTGVDDSSLSAMLATPEAFSTASTSSQLAPSISPSNAGCLMICGFHSWLTSGTASYASVQAGMTAQWNLAADVDANLAFLVATETLTAGGATGTRSATTSPVTTNWVTWSIALNPAPEPTPTGQSWLPFFG